MTRFKDRQHAGRVLARFLSAYAHRSDVIVLALPRGGVPVAFEVARALGTPLDIFLVRKLGLPGHEELAMGAIASGGVRVLNHEVVDGLRVSPEAIERVAQREMKELERREHLYRDDRPPLDVAGKTVILIDDGLATGSTMRAAAKALRKQNPAKMVVAVPVAAPSICEEFRQLADVTVCAATPEPFQAVGIWYDRFDQTSDEEVHELLERARAFDRPDASEVDHVQQTRIGSFNERR
jgi:predicted phosphoribosyltransferase